VAGNGTGGYSGDGAAATSAELYDPTGVAVDSAGNIYIAEQNNNRIRKVSTSGNISTVAGNGTKVYSGDGGAAISAELNQPAGVAVDSAGNIYIADYVNHSIRKVDTSGKISTVAGDGPGNGSYNGDGILATSAELYYPSGVAVDSAGNIYIADTINYRIRKVDASTGYISTVAGNGAHYGSIGDGGAAISAQLYNPEGVVVDSAGNIYIADSGNHRIRKVGTAAIQFAATAIGSSTTRNVVLQTDQYVEHYRHSRATIPRGQAGVRGGDGEWMHRRRHRRNLDRIRDHLHCPGDLYAGVLRPAARTVAGVHAFGKHDDRLCGGAEWHWHRAAGGANPWNDQYGGGQWELRLQRRWRRGDQRETQPTLWRGGG